MPFTRLNRLLGTKSNEESIQGMQHFHGSSVLLRLRQFTVKCAAEKRLTTQVSFFHIKLNCSDSFKICNFV